MHRPMIPHFVSSNIHTPHGFFTRVGGVGSHDFESLNCGHNKGDLPETVTTNRHIIIDTIVEKYKLIQRPQLVLNIQTHSTLPLFVDAAHKDPLPSADALVTNKKGLLLGVLTADCCPILLSNDDGSLVGAIHAGWRGATMGIIENTINLMFEKGAKTIHAAIGPCLWADHFEVQNDFIQAYQKNGGIDDFLLQKDQHVYFDLPGFVAYQLEKSGVASLTNSPYDTYSNKDLFFSYRRKTHLNDRFFGVQLSVIGRS